MGGTNSNTTSSDLLQIEVSGNGLTCEPLPDYPFELTKNYKMLLMDKMIYLLGGQLVSDSSFTGGERNKK